MFLPCKRSDNNLLDEPSSIAGVEILSLGLRNLYVTRL